MAGRTKKNLWTEIRLGLPEEQMGNLEPSALRELFNVLRPMEEAVIFSRYNLKTGAVQKTFAKIAATLKRSNCRVMQIHDKAMRKLQAAVKGLIWSKEAEVSGTVPDYYDDMPIEDLNLSVRAYNCLKNAGISTVGELSRKTSHELLKRKNMGRRSLNEIEKALSVLINIGEFHLLP